MITTHLIVQNNEETIEEALESVLPLNGKILIGDIGSTDKTLEICKKYHVEIVKLSLNNDLGKVRNKLTEYSQTEWNFYIEPWEKIIQGHEEIQKVSHLSHCSIIQDYLITKSIRIWSKETKFKYPVYECLNGPSKESDVFIHAKQIDLSERNLKLIKVWKEKNPLALEPHYYLACILFGQRKWKEFLDVANYFIFQETKQTMASIMTRYYLSLVYFYLEKNYRKSINNLLFCLTKKPLMAEFWCLLGDVYYHLDKYDKAIAFYENAKILGSCRLKTDEWPLEILKYKEYPNEMIENCEKMIQNTNLYQKIKSK